MTEHAMKLQAGLSLLATIVVIGSHLRQGIRRRRGVWTRQSWMTFIVLMSFFVLLLAMSIAMAFMVDRGVYVGMTASQRSLYFWTMTGLLGTGVLGVGMPAVWLARGQPDRQLGPRTLLRPFIIE